MKTIMARWSFVGLLITLATTAFYTPTASAHGEKSQAAFMRMRTLQWFDLNWSEDAVAVNETVEITGKVHVYDGWPETVDKPETTFLNIGIPGPVFIRKASWIGGKLTPRSVTLELDETYDFKVILKARRPGEWHVHTMMNVSGGGPIIGPGKWVSISGSMSDFENKVTTLTGQTVELETFTESTIWTWHILWYVVGLAWIAYFCKGPVFLPRFVMCQAGRGDELITDGDKKVAIIFAVGTLVLVLFSYNSANSSYPVTIPLQAGTMRGMVPLPDIRGDVHVKLLEATYRVPGRAMEMKLEVHNGTDATVRLGEFMAGAIRFMDPDVYVDETLYPENLLAPEGLTVDDNSGIGPDETKVITATATDAAWEIERMSDIIYDPDSQFAGHLHFYDDAGNRSLAIIGGPLIPVFM